jgi:hypothetical protein
MPARFAASSSAIVSDRNSASDGDRSSAAAILS